MTINSVTVNSDPVQNGKEWYGSATLDVDKNKPECIYLQKVQQTEEEVMVIPKSYYNIMRKYEKEFFDMISEKYPENAMANDYARAVDFINSIK